MAATPTQIPRKQGLKRSLSVWQAVGLSLALMAPSMAANINPQGAIGAGRAVPLAFLIATIGALLVAYTFARLCQYFRHSGSVYAFVGATLGPRAGVVAGLGLVGTYTFYAVTTAAAAGIFGTGLLDDLGIWKNQPAWAPVVLVAVFLAIALVVAALPARGGTNTLLVIEIATVALILIVTAVVFVKLIGHSAPGGGHFTMTVFAPQPGAGISALFLGVVFGFLSFAGFESSSTLGEETRNPTRDIPRAIVGVAVFGGVYYVVVTAAEMMGFGTSARGIAAFGSSSSLLGDLGSSYVGAWVGNVITLGTTISAFSCCLASTVGAARLVYAISRDGFGDRGLGRVSRRWGTPVAATGLVTVMTVVIYVVYVGISAHASDVASNAFLWSGTIGTLILLVAYALAVIGMTWLVFVKRRMPQVPAWQIVIPILTIVLLGYTLYRSVYPYPSGDAKWYPLVAGGWLAAAIVAVLCAPRRARRLGAALSAEATGPDDALVHRRWAYADHRAAASQHGEVEADGEYPAAPGQHHNGFVGLGLVMFVTLLTLGVPFAGLWALWVALADFLPMIGGALAGIPTVLFALGQSVPAGVVTLIVFVVYTQIENHILNPIVMSMTVRISPLLVLVAVLVGASAGSWPGHRTPPGPKKSSKSAYFQGRCGKDTRYCGTLWPYIAEKDPQYRGTSAPRGRGRLLPGGGRRLARRGLSGPAAGPDARVHRRAARVPVRRQGQLRRRVLPGSRFPPRRRATHITRLRPRRPPG